MGARDPARRHGGQHPRPPRWRGGTWAEAATFCAVLLAILGAHELGHHAVGRRHGLRVSMPLFLPAPFLVGTLGAILAIRDRPRSRSALLELGAAGPLAGFAVIAAVTALHLATATPQPGGDPLARPLLWWLLGALTGGVPPLTTADPVGYALWVGCLVTAMNLLPFGQLDGGHVAAALAPRSVRASRWAVTAGLVALGALWPPWWAWLGAVWVLAARRPWPAEGPPPSRRARLVALVTVGVFALCFTPSPW
ncbi:MAG: site-2 protease family protein [Myxococcota bacterium]